MRFKKNLECTHCELNYWFYDDNDYKFPITYELIFKFYGTDITAYITTDELQYDAEGKFNLVETTGELLSSFKDVFENNDNFKDKVREVCKKCWESQLDSNHYDYQGLKL